jgi:hypothetical protein
MWLRVDPVRTDISEERVTTIIRVQKIRERENVRHLLTDWSGLLADQFILLLLLLFILLHHLLLP